MSTDLGFMIFFDCALPRDEALTAEGDVFGGAAVVTEYCEGLVRSVWMVPGTANLGG
jgi:aminoglycoside phosphotransferase (APT) family kinase protein